MTLGLSKEIWYHVCMTILFSMLTNHHIKHQATSKMGSQPGDCRWPHTEYITTAAFAKKKTCITTNLLNLTDLMKSLYRHICTQGKQTEKLRYAKCQGILHGLCLFPCIIWYMTWHLTLPEGNVI